MSEKASTTNETEDPKTDLPPSVVLVDLIRRNDTIGVNKFIADPKYTDKIADIVDSNSGLPIITASNFGNVEIVDALIKAGAYVNSTDNRDYETPIYIASRNGNLPLVERLLQEEGIKIDKENKHKKTSLSIACENGYVAIVDLLLKHGADPNHEDKNRETPLFNICKSNKDTNTKEEIILLLMEAGAETNKVNKEGKTIFYFVKRNEENEKILKYLQMHIIIPVKKFKSQKTITVIVHGHGINYGKIIEYPDPRVRILSKVCEGCISYGVGMRGYETGSTRDLPEIIDAYNSSHDPNISTYDKLEFVQKLYNKRREIGNHAYMHNRMQFLINENIRMRDKATDPKEIDELNNIIKRDTNILKYTIKQENANTVNKIETLSVDNNVSFESNDYSRLLDAGIFVIDILNNPDVYKYFTIDDNLAQKKYCIDIAKPELDKTISGNLATFFSNLIRVDDPSRKFTANNLENMGINEYNLPQILLEDNDDFSSLSNRLKIYAYVFLKNLFTTAEQITRCFRKYRTNPDKYRFLREFVPIESDFNDMMTSIEQMDVTIISRYDDNFSRDNDVLRDDAFSHEDDLSLIKEIWLSNLVEKLQKYGFTVINIILEACRVNFDNSIESYEDYEEKVNKTLSDARNVGNLGVFQWAEKKYMDTRKIGGRRRKSFKKGRKSFKKGRKSFSRRRKTSKK